jgi:hypothetical protein
MVLLGQELQANAEVPSKCGKKLLNKIPDLYFELQYSTTMIDIVLSLGSENEFSIRPCPSIL